MKIVAQLFVFLLSTATSAAALEVIRPNPKLTPGAILTTDAAEACRSGYSKSVRHTSGQLKHRVYEEYGIEKKSGHYEVDHLIPLSIGGADKIENLWPESRDTKPWNADLKDRLENYLHVEVCAGHMDIKEAQRQITLDWTAAYRKYLGEP